VEKPSEGSSTWRLGNYEIVRAIGEGGMGSVYEAIQGGLGRRVALKVLAPHLTKDQAFLKRFAREAQSAAALSHPNLVTVYENGHEKERYYFSMEYVDGETLSDRLKREGRLPVHEAISIAAQVATALDYAWKQDRIIHRDVKPGNIMLTAQGPVKVTDLGLAKSIAVDSDVTRAGTGLGTPHYMAPEQSRGAEDVDCRADIYSLGITLYQMITGALPFTGETPYAVVMAHAGQPFPDPQQVDPEIPREVCALLRKMCAKDPIMRYQVPGELLEDLEALNVPSQREPARSKDTRFQEQATVPMTAPYAPARRPRPEPPRPAFIAALAVVCIVAGALLMWSSYRRSHRPGVPPTTSIRPIPEVRTTTIPQRPDPGVFPATSRDARLKELLEYATEYTKAHPDEYAVLIRNFRAAEREAKGTKYALMAQDGIRKVEKARRGAAQQRLKRLRSEARELVEAGRVHDAFAALRTFPEELKPGLELGELPAPEAILRKDVAAYFDRLKVQAAELLGDGKFGEAREFYLAAKGFGLPEIAAAADGLLAALDQKERAAEGERRKKAEQEYRAASEGTRRLVKERKFAQALERCDALANDDRFRFLADQIEADCEAIRKAKSVYDAAVGALSDQAGKSFTVQDLTGTLKSVTDDGMVLTVAGKEVTKPLSCLSARQIAGLAAPSMGKWGGEGSLRLAIFWIYQGTKEAIAEARAHLAEAEKQDLNIQRYAEQCDRIAGGTAGADKARAQEQQPYTKKELADFRLLYEERIRGAASPKDQSALASEMLGASKEFEGGMRYLILDAAKDLAVESRALPTAVSLLELLVTSETSLKKQYLTELLDQRVKLLDERVSKAGKEAVSSDKELSGLCTATIENAIGVCRWNLADAQFQEAKKALGQGMVASNILSATETLRLRRYETIATKLEAQQSLAEKILADDQTAALWAFLEAGAFAKAKAILDDGTGENLRTTIVIGLDEDAADDAVLAAARAWESRADEAKGVLRQVRLNRAVTLYDHRLTGKKAEGRDSAKARLRAISEELGEFMDAVRRPVDWVCLVDYPMESSKVGWGHLGIVTPDKGPLGIAGRNVVTGFAAHAYSRLVFDLKGKFRTLTTAFGLQNGAGGAARFKIVCDGKDAYNGPYMWRQHDWAVRKPVKLNVVGVDKLELISEFHRHPAGAFSAWGDPKVR